MTKDNAKNIIIGVLVFIFAIETFMMTLSFGIINDLKGIINEYMNDKNVCKSQLDSLTQEMERLQNAEN